MIITLVCILLMAIVFFDNKGIPAFLYHKVNETSNITPELLEKHFKIASNIGMKGITMSEYLQGKTPKRSMLFTFDDGYLDNYTTVFPLLKKYDMKATIFLNTAYIGTDPGYMTWAQVEEMYESGMIDFQAHSHRHSAVFVNDVIIGVTTGKETDVNDEYLYGEIKDGYPIFKKRGAYSAKALKIQQEFFDIFRDHYLKEMKLLPEKEMLKKAQEFIDANKGKYISEETDEEFEIRIKKDFILNKNSIEYNIGNKVTFFCWPWGHRNDTARDILKSLGVQGFVTTKKGTNLYKPNWDMIKRVELRKFTPGKFKINLLVCKNLILGKVYSLIS